MKLNSLFWNRRQCPFFLPEILAQKLKKQRDDVRKRISELKTMQSPTEGKAEFGTLSSISEGVRRVNEDMDSFLKQDPDFPVDGSAYNSNRIDWFLLLSQSPTIKTVSLGPPCSVF